MAGLSAEARALLETIAGPESAGAYDVIYGGSNFNDYSDHPRQYIPIERGPNAGQKSSAAGKYQFLADTWDDIASRYGLEDFSPANQDAGAWYLAQEEYARDYPGRSLQQDLASGDVSRVPTSLRNQWTSLPGGIEQGISGNNFNAAYWRNMGIDPSLVPDASLELAMGSSGVAPTGNSYMDTLQNKFLAAGFDDIGMMPGFSQLGNMAGGGNPLPPIGPTGNSGGTRTTVKANKLGVYPTQGAMDFFADPVKGKQYGIPQDDDGRYIFGPQEKSINLQGVGPAIGGGATPTKKPAGGGGIFGGLGDLISGGKAAIQGVADTVGDAAIAGGGALRNKINPLQAIAGVFAQSLPNNNAGQAVRAALGFQNPNVGMTLGQAANGGTMVQGVNGVMNSLTQNSKQWGTSTGAIDDGVSENHRTPSIGALLKGM